MWWLLYYCRWRLLPDERRVALERTPHVDVAGERVGFLAVDEQLHALHALQVGGDRVDDRVDREQSACVPPGCFADTSALRSTKASPLVVR